VSAMMIPFRTAISRAAVDGDGRVAH